MTTKWPRADDSNQVYHPDYTYHWTSQAKTVQDFGDFDKRWKTKHRYGTDSTVALFGTPEDKNFAVRNIVQFDLKPYASLFELAPGSIGLHRALVPAYRRVFENLAKWGGYPIHSFGSSYDPRYAFTNDKVPGYLAKEAASSPPPGKWMEENFERLRSTTPGMADHMAKSDWLWLPRKLFFYDLEHGKLELGRLSNHSYGAAIDVNPRTNGLSSHTWDMPPKVVEIFREEGFFWGGYYSEGQLDAMHFEYMLTEPPASSPSLFFPFSGARGDTPQHQFELNESGEGGFYPVGLSGNLHGGIHLHAPKGGQQPIKASLPGYVVAARLFSKDHFRDQPEAQEFAAGNLGMVLVRHKATAKTGDTLKTFTWHALYLHMSPPAYDMDAADKWNAVPWYRKLVLGKHGCAVDVDTGSPGYGKHYWLHEDFDPDGDSAQGILFPGDKDPVLPSAETLKIKSAEGAQRLIGKPAPEDLAEALASLESGALITFHKPYLPVAQGEMIGVVCPLAGPHTTATGFLHWEWISPTGPAGLDGLLDVDDSATSGLPQFEEKAPNNYFEPDELLPLLKMGLPDINHMGTREKEAVETALGEEPYGRALRDFLKQKATFADTSVNDLKDAFPAPVRNGGLPCTYPLTLKFANDLKLPPPPEGQPYSVKVEFLVRDDSKTVAIGGGKLTVDDVTFPKPFTVQVPAEANGIRLQSDHFHMLEMDLPAREESALEWKLFKDLTSRRCRGVGLHHLNEWTVDGMRGLLDKLKELEKVDKDVEPELLTAAAWYNRTHDDADPLSENPILGPEGSETSLFGTGEDQLPSGAAIANIHPVMGLWLTSLLQKQGKLTVQSLEEGWKDSADREPWWWSMQRLPANGDLGEKVALIAVAKGYSTGDEVGFELSQGARVMKYKAQYRKGVAVYALKILLWGAWKLTLEGKSGPPDPVQGAVLELEGDAPTLFGPMRWTRDQKSGMVTARLFFTRRCPQVLRAFMHLQVRGADGSMQPSGYAIPVEGQKRQASKAALDPATGDFLVGKSKQITEHFTVATLAKACKGAPVPRVSAALAWALDSLVEGWQDPATLLTVSADGRAATFACQNAKQAQALSDLAHRIFPADAECAIVDAKKVTIKVAETGREGGEWLATFDPKSGFGLVISKIMGDASRRVEVGFEFLCPNGADFEPYDIADSGWNNDAFKMDKRDLDAKYGQEILQATSPNTQKLKSARFGDVRLLLQRVPKKDADPSYKLKVVQSLTGNPADWEKANPELSATIPGENLAGVKSVFAQDKMTLTLDFKEEWVGRKISTTAKVKKNPVVFDGMSLNMPAFEYEPLSVPQLLVGPIVEHKGFIHVVAHCNLIPPERRFTAAVEIDGGSLEANALVNAKLVYPAPDGAQTGKMIGNATFEIRLPKKSVGNGDSLSFIFKILPASGGDLNVFEKEVKELKMKYVVK